MAGRKVWAMEMAVVMFGLLAMVQAQSIRATLPRIGSDDPPAFGLVTTSYRIENALNESGFFARNSSIELFGRTFVTGTINGTPVIFVRTSGRPSVHIGMTVQTMATYFNVQGIIHLGRAGSTAKSLSNGTVSVPRFIAFTGLWQWLGKDSNDKGDLVFENYNRPQDGQNLLGSVKYEQIDVINKEKEYKSYFVFPTSVWLLYASRIQIDSGNVTVGLRCSSSDVYVDNLAYARFIYRRFKASTVETSSAAAGLGANYYGLKFISFQGVSNKAGSGHADPSNKELASQNVVKAVIKFIWEATVPRHVADE